MKKIILYLIMVVVLCSFASALITRQDPDLVVLYEFDEASNPIKDLKDNGRQLMDLSCTAGVSFQQTSVGYLTDYAINFSGSDYCFNDSSIFNTLWSDTTDTTSTILFGAYFNTLSGNRVMVSSWGDDGSNGGFQIVQADNDFSFITENAGDSKDTASYTSDNKYNQENIFTVALSNSTKILLLNGTDTIGSTAIVNGIYHGSDNGLCIGSKCDSTHTSKLSDGSKIEFLAIFNRSLSLSEIQDIIDNGILEAATASPSFAPPTPADNANNNTNQTLNVTHTGSDIRYYLNVSLAGGATDMPYIFNETETGTGYKSFLTNFTDGVYTYEFFVQNITNGVFSNPISRTLTIDTINPTITLLPNNWKTDNTTIISSYLYNLTINVSFYDSNLYQTLINITNSTGDSMYSILNTSTTGTTANYSRLVNISYWGLGNYTIKLLVTDDHTVNTISDYDVRAGLSYFQYTTQEGNIIKIISDTLPLTKQTNKLVDRYDFGFNYLFQKDTYKFIVESYNKIEYIEDSDYKAHFVIMGNKGGNWLDFENPNLNDKDYVITKIDDYTYEIEITANGIKSFTFSSLGGLNTVEEHYKFRVGAVIDVFVGDDTNGNYINATVTIGNQNVSMITYNQTNISAARLINITKEITSLTLNASGYNLAIETISVTNKFHNFSFNMTPLNQSKLWFFDEETGESLNGVTISMDVFSDNLSNNYSTNVGFVFITHSVGIVNTIRFNAPGYYERFYFANLTSNVTNITLYMVNETNADVITATIYDQTNNLFEGVFISTLRFDLDSNNYRLVEMGETNFEGETHLHLVQNSEYYKFMLYYPFGTLRQTTERTYIRGTSILFQISTGETVATDFHQTMDVDTRLVFSNITNKFTWTYSDTNGVITQACLTSYKLNAKGFNTTVDYDCLATTSGVINSDVTKENGTTYCANGEVTLNSKDWLIDSLCYTYPTKDSNPAQYMGLLIAFIMTIAFAFAFKYSIELGVIAIPLPLLFCSIMGIVDIATPIVVGIEIAAIVLAIILNKVID